MCFDVSLEDGKIGETCSPCVIQSGGLGPCIAIGIYDKKQKIGYMMHESNADINQEVPGFINYVLNKSKKRNLKVYVAGGEINNRASADENRDVNSSRNYVKSELEKAFEKNQITYEWNNSTDAIELILETESGQFIIERTKMPY